MQRERQMAPLASRFSHGVSYLSQSIAAFRLTPFFPALISLSSTKDYQSCTDFFIFNKRLPHRERERERERDMEVPLGFLPTLWNFVSFLPFFFLLLILGLVKGNAAVIAPFAIVIIFVGNSSVILGLWPAHFLWTYYSVLQTKRSGPVLKILALVLLPVPLILWPIIGIFGSLLVGIGYGFFAPLFMTFEAVGEQVRGKLYHCFADGCWSTIKGSCTIVRDFMDFCFHSYFSYMDELREQVAENEQPLDIKLLKLPSCLLVSLLSLPVDVPMITLIALWKSPCMLLKGWKRLLHDLIGREGPFLETVCVPFAGLAIILWPLCVVAAVFSAFVSSFFLGLYSGFVVYQENSLRMGLACIISVVSLFDEYTNDLLYLREGSCLPRPNYRRNTAPPAEHGRNYSFENAKSEENGMVNPLGMKLVSERSRTLRKVIQQLRPVQVWDWIFRSCELNGKVLVRDGVITILDIEEWIFKGNSRKLSIRLPAYCILQCLFISAKSNSPGLLLSDEVELTRFNWPEDKLFEWFLGPLLIMKEQIKRLQLNENEMECSSKLVMSCNNERLDDWNESCFPSVDEVRQAQLQAILRRLQGIVAFMSRMPTFRRRFKTLMKTLYVEAINVNGSLNENGGTSKPETSKPGRSGMDLGDNDEEKEEGAKNKMEQIAPTDIEEIV